MRTKIKKKTKLLSNTPVTSTQNDAVYFINYNKNGYNILFLFNIR